MTPVASTVSSDRSPGLQLLDDREPGSRAAVGHPPYPRILYGQCWEDADVMLTALDVQPGETCLSIASAGDNTLSLLTCDPEQVIAVDTNPAQLHCLALRIAAYRSLEHGELLELIGSRASRRRESLYRRCRGLLAPAVREFWDAHRHVVAAGIGGCGRFERYFALFRRWVLPLIHSRPTVRQLLAGGEGRREFYASRWDTWRWRVLFHLFFSRSMMGRFGRDASFFRYADGAVAPAIFDRVEHALKELDPAENPYLQWILTGLHPTMLPHALRREHFDIIRRRVDRVTLRCMSLQDLLRHRGAVPAARCRPIDRYNLSDIFEYVPAGEYQRMLSSIVAASRPEGRLAYWNMLVPRSCTMLERSGRRAPSADRLRPLDALAESLHRTERAFFYSRLVVEEVR
jgi:S-adenosylmethionine-diacylglycerol 3-amino-3-carboxypropyl transferase